MSVPAVADQAAVGLALTIDGPRATIAVDRQDHATVRVPTGHASTEHASTEHASTEHASTEHASTERQPTVREPHEPTVREPVAREPAGRVPSPSAALSTVLAGIGRSLPGSVRLVILRIAGGSSPSSGGHRAAAGERPSDDQPAGGRTSGERPADGGPAGRPSDAGVAARRPATGDLTSRDTASRDTASRDTACHDMARHDLRCLDAAPRDTGTAAGWQAALGWLSRPDLFSVAVVSGYAVDALHLALACDLRIACDDAYLSFGGLRHGGVPALGVSRALVDLVGYSRALDLCVTGRMLSGAQAQAVGLVDRLAAPAELDRAVEELAAALLAAPRETAVEVKALLLRGRELSVADQLRAERDAQVRCSSAPAGAAG